VLLWRYRVEERRDLHAYVCNYGNGTLTLNAARYASSTRCGSIPCLR
jgi:hypothetical protein